MLRYKVVKTITFCVLGVTMIGSGFGAILRTERIDCENSCLTCTMVYHILKGFSNQIVRALLALYTAMEGQL